MHVGDDISLLLVFLSCSNPLRTWLREPAAASTGGCAGISQLQCGGCSDKIAMSRRTDRPRKFHGLVCEYYAPLVEQELRDDSTPASATWPFCSSATQKTCICEGKKCVDRKLHHHPQTRTTGKNACLERGSALRKTQLSFPRQTHDARTPRPKQIEQFSPLITQPRPPPLFVSSRPPSRFAFTESQTIEAFEDELYAL